MVYPTTAAGTETLITTLNNGMKHQLPKIYGDQIVWQDINELNTMGIIYLYNTTSGIETQVSDSTDYNYNPAISGNNVVWTDCGSSSACSPSAIYLYNISSGATTRISDGSTSQDYSAIYGNRIVWQDSRNPTSQIYINGTLPGGEKQVDITGSTQVSPAIYANNVVWEDCGSYSACSGNSAIYLYNIFSGITTRISDGLSSQQNPAIYGNRIVWQDNRRDGVDYELFINGTAPGLEYSLSPNVAVYNDGYPPAISGNWVAWVQTNSSNFDIDVNDTSIPRTIPIALDRPGVDLSSVSFSPADSLYRVVWDEQDASGYNVYLYTNTSNGACPVAGFTNDFAGGSAPIKVNFTDNSIYSSSNPITHWFWDFGDGSNSGTLDVGNTSHTYTANRAYDVSLTVSNPYCRNTTTVSNSVFIGKPLADFTASPTIDVVNTTMIEFNDTSLGSPNQWNWSFGDGIWFNTTVLSLKNTTHSYQYPGSYAVILNASNAYGSDTKTTTITVIAAAANEFSNTTIDGINVTTNAGDQQYLVFNYTTLANWRFYPNVSVIDFTPPPGRGFQNISIYTSDPGGFKQFSGNTTIAGTISHVHLQTQDITPSGFSAAIGGPFCTVNYSVDLPSYPENATLNTQIWQGATDSDNQTFSTIATSASNQFSAINSTAYTIKIIKTNFTSEGPAQLHMSLNASLVASQPYGRNNVFVERISDDGLSLTMKKAQFLYYNPSENLDYFEADSPNGLCTFGVSFPEGSANLFQLITLAVSNQVQNSNSGSGSGSGSTPVVYASPAPPAAPTLAAPLATISPSKTETGLSAGQNSNPNRVPPSNAVPAPPGPTAVSTFVGIIGWLSDTLLGHIYLAAAAVIAIVSLLYVRQRRRRFDPLG
jgi:beta propeller repeat protein